MISEVERVIHPQYIIYIQLVSRYARSAKHSLTADIPPVGLSEDGDHPSPITNKFDLLLLILHSLWGLLNESLS